MQAHEGDRSILVVAADGEVRGYDRATGRQVWEHVTTIKVLGMTSRIPGAVELAIHRGRVYAVMRDRIVCLDYASGASIGEIVLEQPTLRPTMVLDGEHLFVATTRALDCYTLEGARLWHVPRQRAGRGDGVALGFPGNVRQGDEVGD